MSSTLADLQRLNIKRMEDAGAPEGLATTAGPDPSNEVSIIPSIKQSFDGVNDNSIKLAIDGSSEASSEDVIIPSSTPSPAPDERGAPNPRPKKPKTSAVSLNASSSSGEETVRKTLEARIREHLMEQLMPQNGKGPVTRLNVEMPEDLHQQLKQHCVKTRTPIKGLINALIAWYLEAEGEA